MKALKEKRISLRSLWRRGLVILSLFALVFASCAESEEEEAVTTDPPAQHVTKVSSVQLQTGTAATGTAALANASYEGLPVDLTGLKVLVRYEDDPLNYKVFEYGKTGDAKYETYPPYAVGVLGEDNATPDDFYWVPLTEYKLMISIGSQLFTEVLTIPDVIPILRDETWAKVKGSSDTKIYPLLGGDYQENMLAMSKGLNLTGNFGLTTYVDAYPSLGQYRLQPDYADGKKKEIPLDEKTKWRITPRYDNPEDPNKTGSGDFWVTVGSNPLASDDPSVTAALSAGAPAGITLEPPDTGIDPALTASHPYDEVYHVSSIAFVEEPKLPDFFYWQSDDDDDWTDRLIAAGAEINVTYTNGETRRRTVEALSLMSQVWHNPVGWLGDGVVGYTGGSKPFAVRGIFASSTNGDTVHNRNRDPKITVLYRGVPVQLQVPVYTRLVSFVAQPADGEASIAVDMRQQDNDKVAMDAVAFSKKIKAVATFSAYMNSELTAEYEVVFAGTNGGADKTTPIEAIDSENSNLGVPVDFADAGDDEDKLAKAGAYSMNFGKHAEWNTTANDWWDPTVDVAKGGWGVCNTVRNNGREAQVVFYYRPPVMEKVAGVTSTSVRNSRVPVQWSGIHIR